MTQTWSLGGNMNFPYSRFNFLYGVMPKGKAVVADAGCEHVGRVHRDDRQELPVATASSRALALPLTPPAGFS